MQPLLDFLLSGCCGEGGQWVWSSPSWLVGIGAALSVLLLLLGFFPRKPPPASRLLKALELLCIGLGLGVGLLMLAGPLWVQEGERREEGRFVVLVDVSRSMGIREQEGLRSDAVARLLEQLPAGDIYTFGDKLKATLPLSFDAPETDLGGALSALSLRYAGEKLAGIALITDGIDRSGLRERLLTESSPTLPVLPGPLSIYAVGTSGGRSDIEITSVRAGGFAFIHTPFTITVEVQSTGFGGRSVPVSLFQDSKPVATKQVALDKNGKGTISFEVTVDKVGRYIFEATTPVVPGDGIPANNIGSTVIRLVRDRVRILQVCGAPSWDQKFLRLFLKEDPGVDLVSFFILRTEADFGSGYSPDELSLIEFPYVQLFKDELKTFDLVIFQNFDYAPYFDREARVLLQNVADFVTQGGAFVMLGGDRSFDLGKYHGTPIEKILPVTLGVSGDPIDITAFTPVLTEAGTRHPLTRLDPDPVENAAWWGRLAGFYGINKSVSVAPGAAVLLEHPSLQGGSGKMPVLAVGEAGAGRTLALMGDSSWRWFLGEAGAGRGNQAYLRFWKNAMRWLIRDPKDQPVQIELSKENYISGELVRIQVKAHDIGFAPIKDARVKVEVSGPDGTSDQMVETGNNGLAEVEVLAGRRGAWRVRASASKNGLIGEAASAFAVTNRDPELDEVEPDVAFLKALASGLGGQFVSAGSFEKPLINEAAGRLVRDRQETKLYSMPLLPMMMGLLLSLGWWLRRKNGYR